MDNEAIRQIAADLREELQREVESTRQEMRQIRDLVQDAIVRLTDSFGSMRAQSDNQLALVTTLTAGNDPDEQEGEEQEEEEGAVKQINIRSFVSETDQILRTFVDHIILVSRQSMEMVHRIDELSSQMNEVASLLDDINAIAELTNVLSLNARIVAARAGTSGAAFSVVAGEVRKLAKSSHEFSDKIGSVVGSAKTNINEAKNIIEVMASKDMSFAIESKGRVDEMMDEVSEMDRYASETIAKVSGIADEINDSVGNAVMSLQFEDMVSQLSASMERKFGVIEQFIETVNLESLSDDQTDIANRVDGLRLALNRHIEMFDEVDRQAVGQSSMDEGDIELF
ncbi:MAG: methyl-accepting chemotaxis protein [Magnetococcales bacterium]|nr:methyl-accepting chemotaxis protein [Magnetococcales bacterium]